MSVKAESALAMHLEGYNCAQSVLVVCGRDRGLPKETAIRVAQAFGGGIGWTGNLCGALTGALMVVGLECSAKDAGDTASKAKAAAMARSVLEKFAGHNSTLLCRGLTGCDLTTEEGMKKFREGDLIHSVCAKAIRSAVEIVEEVLAGK